MCWGGTHRILVPTLLLVRNSRPPHPTKRSQRLFLHCCAQTLWLSLDAFSVFGLDSVVVGVHISIKAVTDCLLPQSPQILRSV